MESAPWRCFLCSAEFETVQSCLHHLSGVHRLPHATPLDAEGEQSLRQLLNRFEEIAVSVVQKDHNGVPQLPEAVQDEWRQNAMQIAVFAQEGERAGAAEFCRKCVFCQEEIVGRSALFQHHLEVHSFNCGNPDNLVGYAELLDTVEASLARLECPRCATLHGAHRPHPQPVAMRCEKTFKNADVLRLHMRKKKHFAINPANRAWDRFWLINYGAGGGGPESSPEKGEEGEASEDEGWSDWEDGGAATDGSLADDPGTAWVDLFSDRKQGSAQELFAFMNATYSFDILEVCRQHGMQIRTCRSPPCCPSSTRLDAGAC